MSMSDHLGESSNHKSWLMLSLWLQCKELLCFHTPAGRSRAEVGTLSCQQLPQSFSRNIQEFPGPQGRGIGGCLSTWIQKGPVPGRSGQIPLFVRKPKSALRVLPFLQPFGCCTVGFVVCRKTLSPAQMKCDFQPILIPVWIGDFACDILLGEDFISESYKQKPCSQSSRTFHISVSVCFDLLSPPPPPISRLDRHRLGTASRASSLGSFSLCLL